MSLICSVSEGRDVCLGCMRSHLYIHSGTWTVDAYLLILEQNYLLTTGVILYVNLQLIQSNN